MHLNLGILLTKLECLELYRLLLFLVRLGKQVGQAVCVERGTVITLGMIIITVGSNVPAVIVYPIAINHDSLMFVAKPGNLGLVIIPQSSWITGPLLLKVLELAK